MNTLKSLAVAFTLVVATLGFTSNVQAEPSRQASHYYVVGINDAILTLLPKSIEGIGEVRRGHLFFYLATPISSDGMETRAFWTLVEFNCTANTVHLLRLDAMDQEGNIFASIPGDEPARSPEDGSVMDNALDAACDRETNAVLLPVEEVNMLLISYAGQGQ